MLEHEIPRPYVPVIHLRLTVDENFNMTRTADRISSIVRSGPIAGLIAVCHGNAVDILVLMGDYVEAYEAFRLLHRRLDHVGTSVIQLQFVHGQL